MVFVIAVDEGWNSLVSACSQSEHLNPGHMVPCLPCSSAESSPSAALYQHADSLHLQLGLSSLSQHAASLQCHACVCNLAWALCTPIIVQAMIFRSAVISHICFLLCRMFLIAQVESHDGSVMPCPDTQYICYHTLFPIVITSMHNLCLIKSTGREDHHLFHFIVQVPVTMSYTWHRLNKYLEVPV